MIIVSVKFLIIIIKIIIKCLLEEYVNKIPNLIFDFLEFYERVVKYKKRGLKVSLALGGWNDSAGDKYSRLVNNPGARAKFVEHAIRFLEKYGFDGLDLDWEYPGCWQVIFEKFFIIIIYKVTLIGKVCFKKL